jgi:hypothetical protein
MENKGREGITQHAQDEREQMEKNQMCREKKAQRRATERRSTNALIEKEKDIFLEENKKLVQVDDDHPEQR